MWKIIEMSVYAITIALCMYQFSAVVPVVARQIEEVVVAQGISTPDSSDANKILELGPWGIVLILCVKLVVDYFNKAKEQEGCAAKIKEMNDHLTTILKELKEKIEKGIEDGYDAISEMQSRIEKETTEIRVIIGRLDQQQSHLGMKTDEMYNWHNLNDDSGGKVWYIRKSLYDSMEKMVEIQRGQSDILRNQQAILDRILKDMEK